MKRLLSSLCIVVFVIMQILLLTGCPGETKETSDVISAQTESNEADEYTILHSPFADGEEWYMTQAFGAYYDACNGNHTGEDWNRESDAGAEIYPIAPGTVIDSGPVSKSNSEYGYYVVIRHTGLFKIPASSGPHLSSDVDLSFLNGFGSYGNAKWFVNSNDVFTADLLCDYSFYDEDGYQYNGGDVDTIYSVYLHLSSKVPVGTEYTDVSTPIDSLAADTGNHPAHLHLEIRVGENDDEVMGSVLAGANGYGYYADSQEMVDAGYREPSSVIQANMEQAETSTDYRLIQEVQLSNIYGNTTGNIANWGYAAQEGDWIYYLNNKNVDGIGLYKISTDDSESIQLNDDVSTSINILNGWIYYCKGELFSAGTYSMNGPIYKMRSDGNDKAIISDENCINLNVVGDWIYYLTDTGCDQDDDNCDFCICKIRTDGTERTEIITGGISDLIVVSDWIYYENLDDNGSIYKISIDGTDNTKLNDDEDCSCLNVVDDWIYYISDCSDVKPTIYKIRTDGTLKTKINDDYSCHINVVEGWIYYSNYNDSGNIYKIRTDGTDNTKLNNDESWSLNVVGDWIYYKNKSDDFNQYKIRTDGTERQLVGSS